MDFQKLADYRNTHNPFPQKLGIHIEEIQLGRSRLTKVITEDDLNIAGMAHGGVFFALSDTAAGAALSSYGQRAVTLNTSFNFLKDAKLGDTLTAEARETKHGSSICIYDVEIKNQTGALVGTGTLTFYMLNEKLDN